MKSLFKIAIRNLFRYTRRTILTSSLIAFGVVLLIVFSGLAGAFKSSLIGTITDSMLANIQIHKTGYVEAIDNIPLTIYLNEFEVETVNKKLSEDERIEAWSPRIKFGAMISNYGQTSNIRLSAVYPEKENETCPALVGRMTGDISPTDFVNPGEIIVPDILVKGLELSIGDEVVIVATNREGSMNGVSLVIAGISDGIMGPQGKDGYIHMEDAKTLLRMDELEISEVAIRLKNSYELKPVYSSLQSNITNTEIYEIHTWEQLSPFVSIARIVDLLIIMVRVILISIVMVSVMNIMMMTVYERTSEIGTIAALGTTPNKISMLFMAEGISLGVVSTIVGMIIGITAIITMNIAEIPLRFGQMDIILKPIVPVKEVIMSSIIVMMVTIFASLQPAMKASNLEPVDALRHV